MPEGSIVLPAHQQIRSRARGTFAWDPKRIAYWFASGQFRGRGARGDHVRTSIRGNPVVPSCVLDQMLAEPSIIPAECCDVDLYFWGTLFAFPCGNVFVRYLTYRRRKFLADWRGLGGLWSKSAPAAILSSQ